MTACKLLLRNASLIPLALSVLARLSAAPAITSVQNAASNLPSALPNGAIARGAIFVIYGSGLGPADLATAPSAFQTTSLSGTSVSITSGGVTADAPLYYTSDKQIAALLPSKIPTGAATITVTYSNQKSPAVQFGVVSNNLGVFTVDSNGEGAGIVTYPDYSLVSPVKAANCGGPYTTCGAANPGDTLIIWGTGLGAVSGDDASGAGLGQNMPNLPLKVWVGGVQANVQYQGRSGCCIGEDQIVFTVPDNAPTGCAVPLAVQITPNITQISNNVVIPIARGSRSCVTSETWLQGLSDVLATGVKNFKLGYIDLNHVFNDPGFRDGAHIGFAVGALNGVNPVFAATTLDSTPLGTCLAKPHPGGAPIPVGIVSILDAGSSFTIKGPKGTMNVSGNPFDRITLSADGAFVVPGDYTISGTGGKDVGPFTASVSIPVLPGLISPASEKGLTVSRASGLTVTWNPNGATGHVEVVLESPTDANNGSTVVCNAPANAGSITIPSYLLFTLATTNNAYFNFSPGVQFSPASSAKFSADGIDAGALETFIGGVSFSGFAITN